MCAHAVRAPKGPPEATLTHSAACVQPRWTQRREGQPAESSQASPCPCFKTVRWLTDQLHIYFRGNSHPDWSKSVSILLSSVQALAHCVGFHLYNLNLSDLKTKTAEFITGPRRSLHSSRGYLRVRYGPSHSSKIWWQSSGRKPF